ncbi:MAG: TetR/AcrR family transcriptional regulator C-terminal domain-containing protein [Eubacterium sp.]|nr:TetR/AcrR family transcriptional regulator C-terminal domain-containing protein [Eubacterium sp.]MDD7209033.1 TetR/AcrR family transcriptional regulator C-terminal domain-containing protein [Lachnospiraceae bacterium]MDY5497272.1 TetR/AcrR family transcriptional regulator C-terminal domain-containing protein [Anaerobutyricum sp.]
MNGTKEKMAQAFKRLVLKKPFQKITISDIAKESAMTRENFYYHFRDKYDILRWIFDREVASHLPADEESFDEWIRGLFENTARDYKYHRRIVKSLEPEDIKNVLYPLFENRVRIMVEESIDDSVWNLRQEKEDFVVDFFTDAFLGFYIHYVQENENPDIDILETGLEFLFDQFLSFVRNSKDENEEQEI